MLLVQQYLRSGKTLEQLKIDHGVKYSITNGKVCLNYDQLEAKNSDPLSQDCRGLVLKEETWDVVAIPMRRFFNMEQTDVAAKIDWSTASFWEKMDGTCIIVYYDHGSREKRIPPGWKCGTRSRCEADASAHDSDLTFAQLVNITIGKIVSPGTMYCFSPGLGDLMGNAPITNTYVFELTTPLNRIVCNYKNEYGLTLLAVRDNINFDEKDPELYLDFFKGFDVKIPKKYDFNNVNHMIQVVRDWNPEEHEGVVVKDINFNRIKVKNPSYVAFNHMRDSLQTSIKGCVEVILLEKEDDVIGMMPEPIANRILRLKPVISEVISRTQKDYEEIKHIDDIKEFALEATKRLWPAALFALKRNKTPDIKTFSLGNKPGEAKISGSAVNSMIELCKKIDPEIVKLDSV